MKVGYRLLALGALVVATTASCGAIQDAPPSPDASVADAGDAGNAADTSEDAAIDSSCVKLKMLESREVTPAGQNMFFLAQNCAGQALSKIDFGRFEVTEDGAPIPAHGFVTHLPLGQQDTFVTLVVDASAQSASYRPQLITALRGFVDAVTARDGRVRFSIVPFGGAVHAEIASSDLDAARVKARLDLLSGLVVEDPARADLFQSILYGIGTTESLAQDLNARNMGGSLSSRYVVAFSSGADTAKHAPASEVATRLQQDSTSSFGVVMKSADYSAAAAADLAKVAPRGVRELAGPQDLATTFQSLGRQIRDEMDALYLFAYCPVARGGKHTVRVSMRAPTVTQVAAEATFSTDPLPSACNAGTLRCGSRQECGGPSCGTCDDRVAKCDGTKCIDHCVTQVVCDNSTITTSLGYDRVCPSSPTRTPCAGECVDTTRDIENCGKCNGHCGSSYATCTGATPVCGCPEGRCPDPVATRQPAVVRMVLGSTHVYFVGSDADFGIRRVPLGGGTVTVLKTSSECAAAGLALSPTSVLATCDRSLITFPLAGGPTVTLHTHPTERLTWLAEPDATHAYFTYGSGAVMRVPLVGGAAETLAPSPGGTGTGWLLRVGTRLFWADRQSASIQTMPVTGGSPTTFVPATGSLTGMWSDGTWVYWSTGIGAVSRAPVTGGAASSIWAGSGTDNSMTTSDSANIYYTTRDAMGLDTLFRRPIGGAASTQLASGLQVNQVRVDGTHVYVATGAVTNPRGTILRVPK
ncbi:MAG: hypothetical protein HOO96_14955 [Polyangiaceae bacterium]|nr:hypothetical protein [Polyangiaceae bacterium]